MPEQVRRRRVSCLIVTLGVVVVVGYGPLSTPVSSSDGAHEVPDQVRGNLIQLAENGAWSWFQDERVIIDPAAGKLVAGASANRFGLGGIPRDGDIDAMILDLETGRRRTFTLKPHLTVEGAGDDHNAPALLIRPDGSYLAVYTSHNRGTLSYYRIHEDGRWVPERSFDWNTMPGGTDFPNTYSNPFYLSGEDRVYNFARADDRSPNIMVSDDLGAKWSYGGQLTEPEASIGYVNGYFKYASDGVDRIDFIATEHHPRDFDTSIYHGYVQAGGSHATDGTLIDADISDKSGPPVDEFTRIFKTGTAVDGVPMTNAWPIDLQTYDDGTIAALFQARADGSAEDHRFFRAHYDGDEWSWEYLGKAGQLLQSGESDYTGLGALDPDDPGTVYLSTPIDPRDDAEMGVHEIFEGSLGDDGWSWVPLTWNSTRDNLRPVVPAWNGEERAVIWLRGNYRGARDYDAAVVGVFSRDTERTGALRFVDASGENTQLVDGSPLAATGPTPGPGQADGRWHRRTGLGVGGVLASAETGHEDAPTLNTSVPFPDAGTYDVWVNFWAQTTADWRIKAGLSDDDMQVFRQMASQRVGAGAHKPPIALTGSGGTDLYQAYLGRVDARAGSTIDVLVDDYAFEVGPSEAPAGGHVRTWYEGISYAPVRCPNLRIGDSTGDVLAGTEAGDAIRGGGGNDVVKGRGGADCLDGEGGKDKVRGGGDEDEIKGGKGRDRLQGGKAADKVNAGKGRDTVKVKGGGRDRVSCGAGRDRVEADRKDRLRGCEQVRRR